MNGRSVLIVGASVAGVQAARSLRALGHEGRIVLAGAEPQLPYDKPPLSKQFLTEGWDTGRVGLLSEQEAHDQGIELRLGSPAVELDPAGRLVRFEDGGECGYDVCVVATGAHARPSPWQVDSGLHLVRSLADATALRADLARGGDVVVIGAGFIGAETASTAASLGCGVTVVDPAPVPMERVLGAELGELFASLHERHGVGTRFGRAVWSVTGAAGDLAVTLDDGEILRAHTVVVGIGAVPNDGWLAGSGLRVENGVVCDEYCRAVGAEDVFAAGDVARWFHPDRREHLRVEHWTNAVDQAALVAHNIVHPEDPRPYAPVEYVWSDQYDWKIQIVGRPSSAALHTVLGSFDGNARGAALFGDAEGRLTAAVTVNRPRALLECRRLVAAGSGLDVAEQRVAATLAKPPVPTSGAT
ncbi:NAD(P)/FAD-dependent oxidoreductase [Streptomyces griseiscabiei]|uniref:FAD-dependent oxidoreductase n=1 Tax=Streptomyces griseiscabiei TaxID=2993540 RepID=A0ABU4LFK3_9ACTN|nr:FAD-dependent oxidoreductase [Streptomyces griseiscabiei]MBZ3900403.1 FAD-dependent oxidoreductase [Streptomyces griseiscabiei]MDX2914571.1 FAD-dependent oxidoreductase [Streptomyces griseiscabiei]